MKLFILLFSFCLVAAQSSPPKKMSDRQNAGFIGPVKSVYMEYEMTEQNYGDRLPGKPCRGRTEVYNESGQLTQRSIYFWGCGVHKSVDTYKYAADGSRTHNSMEILDKNSPPPTITFVKGNIGPVREIFRYDSAGKLIETSFLTRKKKLIRIISYEYDSAGRLIETKLQQPWSKDFVREVQGYEGNNKIPSTFSTIISSGRVWEMKTYSDYEFNSQGDWIKRKVKAEKTREGKQTLIETRKIEYWPT